jgi:DNA repair exonuclease SbcCD nuclease subunit
MSGEPFRFLHAADFHLERPMEGLAEVPEHLRDALVDAPFQAVEQVIDTALVEEVDFVVLAGDLLDCRAAGPRAMAFLVNQLHRLAERKIPVYWAGGEVDPPDRWPAAARLPANVKVFPPRKIEEVQITRGETVIAVLRGASCDERHSPAPGEFRTGNKEAFSLAVAHGPYEASSFAKQKMDYWALGGQHEHKALIATSPTVIYAGTPQGRSPEEDGAHGCVLVHVDERGQARTKLVPTDVIRWRKETVLLRDNARREDLEKLLRERIQSFANEAAGRQVLVAWEVQAAGRLAAELRRGKLAGEIIAMLRNDFGHRSPAAWTVSLEAERPATLPDEWYEEDTILGDFLREVRKTERDAPRMEVESLAQQENLPGSLTGLLTLRDADTAKDALWQACLMGADLLRGEEL